MGSSYRPRGFTRLNAYMTYRQWEVLQVSDTTGASPDGSMLTFSITGSTALLFLGQKENQERK